MWGITPVWWQPDTEAVGCCGLHVVRLTGLSLASEYGRYGYRRVTALVQQAGG